MRKSGGRRGEAFAPQPKHPVPEGHRTDTKRRRQPGTLPNACALVTGVVREQMIPSVLCQSRKASVQAVEHPLVRFRRRVLLSQTRVLVVGTAFTRLAISRFERNETGDAMHIPRQIRDLFALAQAACDPIEDLVGEVLRRRHLLPPEELNQPRARAVIALARGRTRVPETLEQSLELIRGQIPSHEAWREGPGFSRGVRQ